MNYLKFFNFKTSVSFISIILLGLLLNKTSLFLLLFVSVTSHELAHILLSKKFNLKTSKIMFTFFGEIAIIEKLEMLSPMKRTLVYLAGPFTNILFVFISSFIFSSNGVFLKINVALAIFNLLPIYPLDGGRILQIFLTNKFGILNGNKILLRFSKVGIKFLIFTGFIQVILYPFNVSLILVGLYLQFITQDEYYRIISYFYNNFVDIKYTKMNSMCLEAKIYVISKDTTSDDMINLLNWDFIYFFYILNDNEIVFEITEFELIKKFISFK